LKKSSIFSAIIIALLFIQCSQIQKSVVIGKSLFPNVLTHFVPYQANPLFTGDDSTKWDHQIRERGYILKEKGKYHLWYTGYSKKDPRKFLGYATSKDGIQWERFQGNPIVNNHWVEDVFVIKSKGTYYLFAEGQGDTAHMFTSTDRIHWKEKGNLDIRNTDGSPISKGPFGTPTVYIKNGVWYLFYERDDRGIWLATSKDAKTWTNVQDTPVIKMGPDEYDQFAVAMNQVIKYKGKYYGYYHASAFKDWHEWSTNIAVSKDLIHWTKYKNNPIIKNNQSSGIVVKDHHRFRLYTMHRRVNLYLPE
jgi:predicted GH43/DUF377 family glycosyl hydrolase